MLLEADGQLRLFGDVAARRNGDTVTETDEAGAADSTTFAGPDIRRRRGDWPSPRKPRSRGNIDCSLVGANVGKIGRVAV